ncbi:MAG TPA: CoA transferase [Burkholderiales bacterium]
MNEETGAQAPGYDRPLAGVRVLDLSQGIAGPYCGMLLAQYGAEVIKVEPAEGDWGRGLGRRVLDQTPISLSANRGKHSIALDLKTPEGRALLARLVARADVFLENFRPGVATRLGVGYEAMKAQNPRLIYLSISAFGQQGPRSRQPGSDTVAQAYSGMMMVNRDAAGTPKATGFYTADFVTALYGFQAVAMALAARAHEQAGRYLDISLIHASAAFLVQKGIEGALEGAAPGKLNAPAGSYRTKDGWIAITLTRESHFASLVQVLGREDLLADARFANFVARGANSEALVPEIQRALLDRRTAEWLEALGKADVLCSPIHTVIDFAADAHVGAIGLVAPAALPGAPAGTPAIPWIRIPGAVEPAENDERRRWPGIGADAREILAGALGMAVGEIDALIAAGAVRAPDRT